MPIFDRLGLKFHLRDEGHGLPLVFQHGFGGYVNQPIGLFKLAAGIRLNFFDMRGHGQTRPLGDVDKLTIESLADDLIALVDHFGIQRAVIGGISLGAAVAVNVALRYPERVLGLVIVPWPLAASLSEIIPGRRVARGHTKVGQSRSACCRCHAHDQRVPCPTFPRFEVSRC
jgi:pimeloyl-ACP methyl ester carboxylesterase